MARIRACVGAKEVTMAKRFNLTITDPQDAYLTAEAARLGITISDLIRRIIDEYRTAKDPEGNNTNGSPK
jgi:hypothetical protein